MLPLFMQRNNFTESDCSPRTRYFPLICPTRYVLPASKISSARQPFQSGQSVYLYVRRRPKHWEKERCKNSLARFIHAHATSAGVASRFIHRIRLCTCDFMYICVCARVSWLRGYAAFPRRLATRCPHEMSRKTRGTKSVSTSTYACRTTHTRTHTHIRMYTSISIPVMLYQRSLSHTARRE